MRSLLQDLFRACPEFMRHKVGDRHPACRPPAARACDVASAAARPVCDPLPVLSPPLPVHDDPPPHPHPQQELLVSPQLLASHAIPVVRVVHNPREFVVVFPGAYHRWVGGWAGGTSE